MKKMLFIISLIAIGWTLQAQSDAKVVLEKTFVYENVSAQDMKLKAYQWFSQFFKNDQNQLVTMEVMEESIKGKAKWVIDSQSVIFDFEAAFAPNRCQLSFSNLSNTQESIQQSLSSMQDRIKVVLEMDLPADVKHMLQEELSKAKH